LRAIELAPEGTGYRAKTRFAKFYNLPELMAMFKDVADIQTADMLNLPVPKANYHNVVIKPSEQQVEMVAGLSERADRVRYSCGETPALKGKPSKSALFFGRPNY
jgi:N12 class adenine-specific DNA methylase